MATLIGGTPATNLDFTSSSFWGGTPANGDILVLKEPGTYTFTSNLSNGSLTLAGFKTMPGVNLVQRSPITLAGITTSALSTLSLEGSGVLYLSGGVSITSVLNPAMNVWALDGAWANIHAEAGYCNVNDDSELVAVSTGPQGLIEIETHASDTVATAKLNGGTIISRRNIVLPTVHGRLRFEEDATFEDGANGGACEIGIGGRVEMAGSATSGDDLLHYAGVFDMTEHGASFVVDNRTLGPRAVAITSYSGGSFSVNGAGTDTPLGPNKPPQFPLGAS